MSEPQVLLHLPGAFDYDLLLGAAVADQLRTIAARIRPHMRRNTVDDVIERGNGLRAAKRILPSGHYELWVRAEFDWGTRMAQIFVTVAEWLGGKAQLIAHSVIQPTAAYNLAAPSVRDEARQQALERAEAGEKITRAVARDIIAAFRDKFGIKVKPPSAEKRRLRLVGALEKHQEKWYPTESALLVQELRDYADALAMRNNNGKLVAKAE